jgi:nitrite reductase (NADH) small subunit
MAKHAIGPISQIPKGEGRNFLLDGVRVAVFRTRADEIFATQADCPHLAGPLADGMVDAATVVCPLHERMFSLRTGEGIGTDCALTVYPVQVVADGTMLLSMDVREIVTAA